MLQLLDFFYRQRVFLLFLTLEALSFWLIFSYNHRYNTYFVNSSNRMVGEVTERVNSVEDFLDLQLVNENLAQENLRLRRELSMRNFNSIADTISVDSVDYELISTKVVNATHRKAKNFLTLRINAEDSIRPGMGVLSANGVVGTVKSVSNHFATVTSILNPKMLVSARAKSNGSLATVQWDGLTPLEAELKYIPRHLKLSVGDSVVTSGFSSVYPADYLIGTVSFSELKRESPFYTARINLATDFTNIRYAYVVKVLHVREKELLEEEVDGE